IAAARDVGGVEWSVGAAFDRETVGALLASDAEGAEDAGHRGDAIRLLHPELGGAFDDRDAARAGREGAEHREPGDGARRQLVAGVGRAEDAGRGVKIADRFAELVTERRLRDRAAHRADEIEEAGAGRVEPDAANVDA